MEVDPSVQTSNTNYIKRSNPFKRRAKSENLPRKQQRVFHTVPEESEEQDTVQEPVNDEKPDDFLDSGHLTYHGRVLDFLIDTGANINLSDKTSR